MINLQRDIRINNLKGQEEREENDVKSKAKQPHSFWYYIGNPSN